MSLSSREQDVESIGQICAEHSNIVSAERHTAAATEEERLHLIISLQQKAQALDAEVRERKRVQKAFQESEVELADFLDNAAIGMHWIDGDGTISWANKAELALLGYRREEYVGHHVSEFYVDKNVVEEILRRFTRHEELNVVEARLKCKDGSVRDVRMDSNILRRDGSFVHTRCFITDITEAKQAEQGLFRLAAIVKSSSDAIITKDLNGIITSWNDSAERLFGYKAAEAIGRPITLLIPSELLDDERHILAKIRVGERIEHFETVRLHKNGDRIDVSLMRTNLERVAIISLFYSHKSQPIAA